MSCRWYIFMSHTRRQVQQYARKFVFSRVSTVSGVLKDDVKENICLELTFLLIMNYLGCGYVCGVITQNI